MRAKTAKTFVDTNILVYAFTSDEPEKQKVVMDALGMVYPVVSTQVIKEFTNVLIKKTNTEKKEIENVISEIKSVAEVVDESLKLIYDALDIHVRHGFSFYDSLVVATAIHSRCCRLFSEDMQHMQEIDDKLIILNPLNDARCQ